MDDKTYFQINALNLIARSHMPQLFTAFPIRPSSAGDQKSDFDKIPFSTGI